MDPDRLALYFGYGTGGHFLYNPDRRHSTLDPAMDYPGFPWRAEHLDTGLLRNRGVDDRPDGLVHWTCGGKPGLWHAFVWWDRSGDKRGASNSGFYVRGFPVIARDEAFGFACIAWPEIVDRQLHPLQLVRI